MVRVLIGGLAGGIVMFITGFVFWASPLNRIAYSAASEQQSANVQLALANNLASTGRYIIPNPETPGGTVLYGKGPVATVDYNTGGFSMSDGGVLIGGLIQEVVVSLMIGLTLLGVAGRVADFPSRAKLVIGLSAAATVLLTLSDPIWMHAGWRFAIYDLIADLAMLVVPGLVIARWFVPGVLAVPPSETVH